MLIFIDSANIKDIEEALKLGVIGGITTNPSLVAKEGGDPVSLIQEIAKLTKVDISAEVFSENYDDMIKEGEKLLSIAENIVVKLPLTQDGIRACSYFLSQQKSTNVTLCFSASQALLAARAGASYVSPFIGRLDDSGVNGLDLIKDIKQTFSNYSEIKTKILAASIRSVDHVVLCAKIGADAATMPLKIIRELYNHELTDKGLAIFREDIKSIKS